MKNQKGVTLIELLIVILIMVSISSLAFYLFSYGTKMERAVAIENELQREARFIMETISNSVRDGEAINNIIVYSNREIKLVSGNVLSQNVDYFQISEKDLTDGRKKYTVLLKLEKNDHSYSMSTEVFNDSSERILNR